MKWFGKKAAQGSARPALARGFGMAFGSGEWPRSYEAQVRDAYVLNPVAQRAVRLIAESVGSAPIACSEPEAARLIATQSGGQGLMETVASHLLLHGIRQPVSTASALSRSQRAWKRRAVMRCGAAMQPWSQTKSTRQD
jgi:hypothetical protein